MGDCDIDLEPCPNCGREIPEGVIRCPYCGKYTVGMGSNSGRPLWVRLVAVVLVSGFIFWLVRRVAGLLR